MIFDTNVFIYADRGVESAKELLLSTPLRAISTVTYMEYITYCRNKKELRLFETMLEALQFTVFEIDAEISLQARKYVRMFALSHSMEMGDAIIASTAIARTETLCASNVKHFKHIAGLEIKHYNPG